jgi:hypothetical protein
MYQSLRADCFATLRSADASILLSIVAESVFLTYTQSVGYVAVGCVCFTVNDTAIVRVEVDESFPQLSSWFGFVGT